MHSCTISGLSVLSDIALPGTLSSHPTAGAPEVVIRSGAVPLELENSQSIGMTWQLSGEHFLLRMPGIARFLLTSGREIVFEVEGGTAESDIAIFLVGTVFGILLHQRGRIVLHASAVRVGDKAVLFSGPSGAGKSTLAAALVKQGFPFVTDDVCAVLVNDKGRPMVQPDGRQLKLWEQAVDKLDLASNRGAPVRDQLRKYFVEPGDVHETALPLGALYFLREARPPHAAGIERPNIVDAALLIRGGAYRPSLVRRMNQRADYFRAATAITNHAGLFFLTRPLDFAEMPNGTASLRAHWAALGLLEPALA